MPISKKNQLQKILQHGRLQKALEQRDQLIKYIQESTTRPLTPTEFRELMHKVVNRIGVSNIMEYGANDVQAIVELPDSLGKSKEYFLSALFETAKYFNETHPDKATKLFAHTSAQELWELYYKSGNRIYLPDDNKPTREDCELAKAIYEQALSKAEYTANAVSLAATLRNIALVEFDLGNTEGCKNNLIEALKYINTAIIKRGKIQGDVSNLETIRDQISGILVQITD